MLAARIKDPDELSGLGADAPGPAASGSTSADVINAVALLTKSASEAYTTIKGKPKADSAATAAMLKQLADAQKRKTEQKSTPWTTYALIGGGVLLLGVVLAIVLSKGKK